VPHTKKTDLAVRLLRRGFPKVMNHKEFIVLKLVNRFDNSIVNVHGNVITGIFIGMALTLLAVLVVYVFAF